MSDAAVFQALIRKRVDLAEQWLMAMPEEVANRSLRTRVAAAILQARGDVLGALAKLDEFERLVLADPNEERRQVFLLGLPKWRSTLATRHHQQQQQEGEGG